jgi:hypothetical protein
MRLEDCYRLLEIDPRASGQEVKRAYRDLTKVWHPDRFGNDSALRQKAEEKLKAINEAYETIRASRAGDGSESPESERHDDETPLSWRVRWRGREARAANLQEIVMLVDRGGVGEDAEVFDPGAARWRPLVEFAELRDALTRRRVRRNRGYALTCVAIALFVLLRRPSPAGLVIALVLFIVAAVFIARMRPRTGD